MKVITVIQPWALLLATGKKKMETRSWKTNYQGKILIHAGKKPYSQVEPLIPAGDRKRIRETLRLGYIDWRDRIPTGAIIGIANLVNCVAIDEKMERVIQKQYPDEYAFGDFTAGRYAWVMEDPVLFEKPIPAKGKQGLWNYEGALDDESIQRPDRRHSDSECG